MSARCSPLAPHVASEHYWVVCLDYRTAGREAIVDPSFERADIIARLKSREYKDVSFIHEICDGIARRDFLRVGAAGALALGGLVRHVTLLGLDNVKNYDGSWTEYGNVVAAPIEKG